MLVVVATTFSACYGRAVLSFRANGDRVQAGIQSTEVADGWALSFTKFEIALDSYEAESVSSLHRATPPKLWTKVDFATVKAGGFVAETTALNDTVTGVGVGYATTAKGSPAVWVSGQATHGSEKKTFSWGLTTAVLMRNCPIGNASRQIELFGNAQGLFRREPDSEQAPLTFQSIADADTDLDGVVTEDELRNKSIVLDSRYQVSGSGITTLWELLEHQSASVLRVNGLAPCQDIKLGL